MPLDKLVNRMNVNNLEKFAFQLDFISDKVDKIGAKIRDRELKEKAHVIVNGINDNAVKIQNLIKELKAFEQLQMQEKKKK